MTIIEVLNDIEAETRTRTWVYASLEARKQMISGCISSWDGLSDEQRDSITSFMIGAPPEPVAVKKVRKMRIKKTKAPEKPLVQHANSEDRVPF